MRYFRNVVTAAVAVTTATSFVLTVLACFTGIRSIRMVYLYRIMPSCRRLLCFIVLMKMNDVKQTSRREKKNHTHIITR